MATVEFTVQHDFRAPAEQVWAELIDWKAHEAWIPATRVEVAPGDPLAVGAQFTAWTGFGRLALEDRMRVASIGWDDDARRGTCRVDKLGPVLKGSAGFTVEPVGDPSVSRRSRLEWIEDVTVPYLPRFAAPLVARLGAAGFGFGMRKLAKELRSRQTSSA